LNEPQRRELEQDLELASRIQSGLLPRNDVRRGGWEIGYHYEPAGAVSGDYCDVVTPAGTEDLYFFVGDVSGKGVAASLLMSHLHAIVRTLLTVGTALPQVIERASHMFCENTPSSLYATLACGHARPSGEVDLANAGHCRPVLVRSGRCSAIESAGLPLGLFCDSRYETTTFRLEPGDSLLLYTDGLIEALNPSGQEYGLERLSTVAAKRRARSARELASACVDDWRAFLAGTRKQDDLTVLAVQRSMAEPRA
jgi:sigma-B regulation protein RsbU (phosphoserine phosphatase)